MNFDMPSVIAWLSEYHKASIEFVEAVGNVLLDLRDGGEILPEHLEDLKRAHAEFNKYV